MEAAKKITAAVELIDPNAEDIDALRKQAHDIYGALNKSAAKASLQARAEQQMMHLQHDYFFLFFFTIIEPRGIHMVNYC